MPIRSDATAGGAGPSAALPELTADLPRDVRRLIELAARSMFHTLSDVAQGAMLVDREGRLVWISEGYKRFLPALGFEQEADFVGRMVEEVVPNTRMREVVRSGRPILVDLLTNKAGNFLVSRLPLRDEQGQLIGALGLVLMDHPETHLQPLMAKFSALQRELEEARRQLAEQRRPKYGFGSFIGAGPAALEVKRQARRVAQTNSPVLLLGETGTGKELLAHAIHGASARATRPFIGVNIAAVPETLLEAEFFGVAPGAYTGADRKGREGKFVLADGGTLFLDEIGDMPVAMQAKLLRALQEQEVEPLGSNRVRAVNVRVIAATSRDLAALVREGQFREDLYYRLNVLPIRVPALRDRLEDLEPLVEALTDDIARRSGMLPRELRPDAFEVLRAYPWRGNIRELRNVLEQVCMLSDDLLLTAAHLRAVLPAAAGQSPAPSSVPSHVSSQEPSHAPGPAAAALPVTPAATRDGADPAAVDAPSGNPPPLTELVARAERNAIEAALQAAGGNKVAAARLLQISRATLYEKMAALGMAKARPRL